jgi:hypothetical protein
MALTRIADPPLAVRRRKEDARAASCVLVGSDGSGTGIKETVRWRVKMEEGKNDGLDRSPHLFDRVASSFSLLLKFCIYIYILSISISLPLSLISTYS